MTPEEIAKAESQNPQAPKAGDPQYIAPKEPADAPSPAADNAAPPLAPQKPAMDPEIEALINREMITPSNKEVIIIAEQFQGVVQNVSYELLGAGRLLADKLGGMLTAILIGHNLQEEAQKLIHAGAEKVYLADHPDLENYRTLPFKRVITDFLKSWELPPHFLRRV
jgi:hypothetical protein